MLVLADLTLLIGMTLRITRFIVADDVPGTWWIRDPLDGFKHRWQRRHAFPSGRINPMTGQPITLHPEPWWAKYLEGLSCPFCMAVWTSALAFVTLWLAGGPGQAADWWRYGAGALALSWLVGHVAAWAGDTAD